MSNIAYESSLFFVVYPYPIASDVLEEGLNALGKKDKEARPTPTLPDVSPDTRSDEKTDKVRGQVNVKHPPPPPAVNAVDGLDEVMHITFRSFMLLFWLGGTEAKDESQQGILQKKDEWFWCVDPKSATKTHVFKTVWPSAVKARLTRARAVENTPLALRDSPSTR